MPGQRVVPLEFNWSTSSPFRTARPVRSVRCCTARWWPIPPTFCPTN